MNPRVAAIVLFGSTPFIAIAGTQRADLPSDPPGGLGFVTIGDAGNVPYPGGPSGQRAGVGRVDYEFRMGRTEVTTAQWLDFVNAVDTFNPVLARDTLEPVLWGAHYQGGAPGSRWTLDGLPQSPMTAVGGITWRSAAMYCNWLHNDRAATQEAITSGAYDASTFTTNADGSFNDQLTRSPGARYWIPSENEWLKASHYDPNHSGLGLGGWWTYPYQSESPPVTGLPGTPGAQTSADFESSPFIWYEIPLGAYSESMTAYGLIDVSGGAQEWTEQTGLSHTDRRTEGSWIGRGMGAAEFFNVAWRSSGSGRPGVRYSSVSFRVAATVPEPCGVSLLLLASILCQRRYRCCHQTLGLSRLRCRSSLPCISSAPLMQRPVLAGRGSRVCV